MQSSSQDQGQRYFHHNPIKHVNGRTERKDMQRETGSPADFFSHARSLRPGKQLMLPPNWHAKVVCIGWRLVALFAEH